MTTQLDQVITAARVLSTREKLELLQVISRDLQQTYDFSEATARFWKHQSIEDIAAVQTAPTFTNKATLIAGFWPEEESADDINAFIAERRHKSRLS